MAPADRLRVLMLVDAPRIPRWQGDVIERLRADTRIALHVAAFPARSAGRRGRRRPGPGFRLADAIERVVSRRVWHPPLLRQGYDGDTYVAAASDAGTPPARPDVVLSLSANAPPSPGVGPRFGVWTLEVDGVAVPDAGPFGYYAVASDDPLSRLAIVAVGGEADASGATIAQALCKTFRPSWNENRRRLEARAATLVVDALVGLAVDRRLPAPVTGAPPPAWLRPRPIYPWVLARCLARLGVRAVQKLAYEERWQLALFDLDETVGTGAPARPRFVTGPFRADPCLEQDGEDIYVFHETMGGTPAKGEISVLRLRDGEIEDLGVAIAQPYHMSFPMVFRVDGERWMIPESSANGTIELWRAENFPLGWVKDRDLMTGVSASDTVLWRGADRWWMFTNIDRRAAPDHCHELHLFWSDDFRSGTWHPHPMNPVVRDVSRARMAGRIFQDEAGRLVRCAQDNRFYYGDRLRFMHIDELTPAAYREHEIDAVDLGWVPDANGQHHIDRLDSLVVTDVRFRWPRWRRLGPIALDQGVVRPLAARLGGLEPSGCGRMPPNRHRPDRSLKSA
ncbi:glucosamine inositolphosphorylceramide transferase family protein [Salinarimonas sp. NSM]|uniref:glucosamine inositolphosphorylceramide transferase family protein n=1 Tax=Salinarimonas sp. NSM TaxID=3458003 RepID=UPI004035EC7C